MESRGPMWFNVRTLIATTCPSFPVPQSAQIGKGQNGIEEKSRYKKGKIQGPDARNAG